MATDVSIDLIRPEDPNRIVEVWEASVRATHDFLEDERIDFFRPYVLAEAQRNKEIFCARDATGRVVGFGGVEPHDGVVKLEMLFIDPKWFGQGVGRRLLEHSVNVLGASVVDVNEQNAQAVGFYQHMGFEVFARSETDGMGLPYPLLHMRLKHLR